MKQEEINNLASTEAPKQNKTKPKKTSQRRKMINSRVKSLRPCVRAFFLQLQLKPFCEFGAY